MASRFVRTGFALAVAVALGVSGCSGSTSVSVVDDPRLEAEFESVLVSGQARTLGEITAAAGIESWDRMYYFRVPVLMSELNRMMHTPGVTWRSLPGSDAEGLIVFVSQEQIVRAVADREPPLYLSGFATSDSSVTPDELAGIPRLAVESRGR
ncbi:hypothetical protein [Rhodococcus sp. B50]|uniref:hypothetical protein n=1 Tax=Rhodococcus sp. B50 TaxID=2682847 RepID=UPI0027DC7F18|nr:hypothetical protein [Rhodococcus sp. B50]MBS9373175.1 hypothetical protein [Rhodococcus sp. B50]